MTDSMAQRWLEAARCYEVAGADNAHVPDNLRSLEIFLASDAGVTAMYLLSASNRKIELNDDCCDGDRAVILDGEGLATYEVGTGFAEGILARETFRRVTIAEALVHLRSSERSVVDKICSELESIVRVTPPKGAQ